MTELVNDEGIFVMNTDGGEVFRLTNSNGDARPAWSPDGKRIAFESYRDGNREIYEMNSDGSNQINITNNTADDMDPAWSPQ